jgi:hypothetical protein
MMLSFHHRASAVFLIHSLDFFCTLIGLAKDAWRYYALSW